MMHIIINSHRDLHEKLKCDTRFQNEVVLNRIKNYLAYYLTYYKLVNALPEEENYGDFTLHVKSILSAGDAVCTFVWDQPADETAVADIRKNRQESLIRPFSFHCAELLRCTKEILEETVPQKSMEILSLTENDFRALKPEAAEFFVQNDSDNVF